MNHCLNNYGKIGLDFLLLVVLVAINGAVTRYLSEAPGCYFVSIAQSIVFYVEFCGSFFFFFAISFNLCFVCPWICGSCLPIWYLQTFIISFVSHGMCQD